MAPIVALLLAHFDLRTSFFMSTSDSSSNLTPVTGSTAPVATSNSHIDEKLHGFWEKNGKAIGVLCVIVALFYIGKAGYDYLADQREAGVQAEYAKAVTVDNFKAFIAAHPGHSLSGLANLQIADAIYGANQFAQAVTEYSAAAAALPAGPFASRAQLGLAMAKIQAGQATEGQALLRQLADDTKQYQAVRLEAMYQLASLAASAGKGDEVQRLAGQLMQLDSNSPWAQRAFGLQAQVPASKPVIGINAGK
jgi:predicted negative regulator of RcsB-dependent stress response